MATSLYSQAKRVLEKDDKPTFNVVIIYEDTTTGRRAKYFYDKVICELQDDCDFSLELWNFQVLAIPEVREATAQAAAQADLVILSLHGKAKLASGIIDWIERWTRLIADCNPALVALVDKPSAMNATPSSTLAYLRRVVNRYGVSFISHTTVSQATDRN